MTTNLNNPMPYNVQPVDRDNLATFIQYCGEFGKQHDESYLPEADFELSDQQPAYLLYENGEACGAVSLIRKPAYVEARKGRFAIFHARKTELEPYAQLSQAISAHFSELDKVYLFIPQDREATLSVFSQMGYELERISYVLRLSQPQEHALEFASGYQMAAVNPQDPRGLQDFCAVINQAFSKTAGHVELYVDEVRTWFEDRTYLPAGICVLYNANQPIGSVAIFRDMDEQTCSEIISLGVLESYRGQGLGRQLLRYAINFSLAHDLHTIYLSVNGENDTATRLYRSEGFESIETAVCMALKVER